jgi:hypothetical protein
MGLVRPGCLHEEIDEDWGTPTKMAPASSFASTILNGSFGFRCSAAPIGRIQCHIESKSFREDFPKIRLTVDFR